MIDTAGHAMGRDRGSIDRGENELDMGKYELEEQVFGVSAAALVARRDALESVRVAGEYLDESFFMYKEDVDLSWRFRLAGWECWYVPSAVAYHARTSRAPRLESGNSPFRSFHENEKRKPRHVRTNSMKNQWLMLVKNEDAAEPREGLPVRARPRAARARVQRRSSHRASRPRRFASSSPRCREPARAGARSNGGRRYRLTRYEPGFGPRNQAATVVRGKRQPE